MQLTAIGELTGKLISFLTAPPKYPVEWNEMAELHINEEGWLEGDGVVIIPSHPSWYYPKLSTPHADPTAIVGHVSDTPLGTGVVMAKNRARPREKDDRAASWHASAEVDHIVQMAPFHVGCWHAIGQIKGIGPANRTALGFEVVGKETGPFPDGQVAQCARLWRAAVQSYGIARAAALIPHAIIDPVRRSDPGKVFMTKHAPAVLAYAFA